MSKTLETINGRKVWAVDATEECSGCMFRFGSTGCSEAPCSEVRRQDKRNVVFQTYEENLQKTFTLSQINEMIESLIAHPVKNEAIAHWNLALRTLKSKLEQL